MSSVTNSCVSESWTGVLTTSSFISHIGTKYRRPVNTQVSINHFRQLTITINCYARCDCRPQTTKFHDQKLAICWTLIAVFKLYPTVIRKIGQTGVVQKTRGAENTDHEQGEKCMHSRSCGIWEIFIREQVRESPCDRNLQSPFWWKSWSGGLCLKWWLLEMTLSKCDSWSVAPVLAVHCIWTDVVYGT